MYLVVALSMLLVCSAVNSSEIGDSLSDSCVCVPGNSCSRDIPRKSFDNNVNEKSGLSGRCRGTCVHSCLDSEVCCSSASEEDREEASGRAGELPGHRSTEPRCVCVSEEMCRRGFLDVSQLATLGGSLFSSSGHCSEKNQVCCKLLCSCVASYRCHDVALIGVPDSGEVSYCGPGQVCCSRNSTEGLDISRQTDDAFSDDAQQEFCREHPLSISCPSTRKRSSTPTIVESDDFDPEKDASLLRKSFGIGRGTAGVLTSILTKRTFRQRDIISQTYSRLYNSDLYNDASFWTVGLTENTVQHLLRASSPIEYLAIELDRAMSGPGTDEHAVIETLVTSTAQQLTLISQLFAKLTGQSLESRIQREFSGYVATLLLAMVRHERSTNSSTDHDRAQIQAETLYKAGEAVLGTDEAVFVDLLSHLHWTQLSLVQSQYHELYSRELEQDIHREFSGDLRRVLLAIVQVSRNVPAYFASRLNANLASLRREDEDVVRILVSRSEIDLVAIAQEYQLKYQQSLATTIEWKTVGSYEDILLAILGSS